MVEHFIKYIKKEKLFSAKDKILVAVSGGIDSVVMLHLLCEAGYSVGVAHCNFSLRGKESEEDEKFVKGVALKLNVPFYSVKFNTEKVVKERGISIQMAARELRYEWLENIRKQKKYNVIAVAHHSDDMVETFFINLIRGTGIAGLSGIKAKTGNVVRPLLFASRKDIEEYALKNSLKYREDSSNSSDKYLRNTIRRKLIPLISEMNPEAKHNIASLIERLNSVERIFQETVRKEKRNMVREEKSMVTIDIERLMKLADPEIYLFEFVKHYGFSGDVIPQIISSVNERETKIFYSPTHRIIKDRKNILIVDLKQAMQDEYKIPKGTASVKTPMNIAFSKKVRQKNFIIYKEKNIAALDFNKLKFPLTLRRWRMGDYFYPLGMKGKKKLSDFFTDMKFSLLEKENTWLLCSGKDIVWVVGHRIDNRYMVSEKTKIVLTVRSQCLGNN